MIIQIIQEATQWLIGLTEPEMSDLGTPKKKSLRVFSEDECESLSLPSRRFLLSLEQQGILNAALRERIIHHIMELKIKDVDLHVVEGITRIILSRQPEGLEAIKRMDLFIMEMADETMH